MERKPRNSPSAVEAARPAGRSAGDRGVFFIAVFDLVKAVFFLVAAVGVFHLVDRNTHVELTRLLHVFRISGDHRLIGSLLRRANVITNPDKRVLTGVLLLYTALYAVEGTGLLLRKRWAEYFAVLMTAIPLPFEAYTLFHHTGHPLSGRTVPWAQRWSSLFHNHLLVLKLVVLVINVGIVWFLVRHLRREGRRRPKPA